jgi:glutamine amidotransferase
VKVVVFDYGSGNTHSVVRALIEVGADVQLTADPAAARAADGLVVPGVGAFAACMAGLTRRGGAEIIRERVRQGRAVLGICVGHQILFARGEEHGTTAAGLGIYPGTVRQLPTLRLPHMGWNEVDPHPLATVLTRGGRFYFAHSYAALGCGDLPAGAFPAWTTHAGAPFLAAAEYGPVTSTQFHPEKSGRAGLALLARWTQSLGDR